MRPSTWQPPVETSAAEDQIIKRIKRAKLFTFLRRYRHQIFTPEFQLELAGIYKDSPLGQPPVEPAMLALALILQAYTGVSDDEVLEAKALGVIARAQGRELAAVAPAAEAELVAGSSLKAALDLDWDDPAARASLAASARDLGASRAMADGQSGVGHRRIGRA